MEKEILTQIYWDVQNNNDLCYQGDAERSVYTNGVIFGMVQALRIMGHDVDAGSYNENGCDHFSYLKYDGQILIDTIHHCTKFTQEFFDIAV